MRLSLSALATVLSLGFASNAYAQSAARPANAPAATPAPAPQAAGANRPASTRSATPGRAALTRGAASYVARDYAAALAAFREAQTDREARLEALLGVGYATAARGDSDGAVDALRAAVAQAITANDDATRARALQAIAILQEGAGHWADAETAWRDAQSFADSHSPAFAGLSAVARDRMLKIQQRADRERVEAAVRQRIEDRQRHNASQPAHP